jgi:hypothetical protein
MAYFDKLGEIIYKRKKIVRRYLALRKFWLDLLITIPWNLLNLLNQENNPFIISTLRLIRLLRVIRLKDVIKLFDHMKLNLWMNKNFQVSLRIFKLILVILLAAH